MWLPVLELEHRAIAQVSRQENDSGLNSYSEGGGHEQDSSEGMAIVILLISGICGFILLLRVVIGGVKI
jgi:hypothetical protein